MEKEKNGMTVEKSLEIISQAIDNSQRDFQGRSGKIMALWGAVLLLVAGVVMLGLALSGNRLWHLAWFAIPFIGWPLHSMVVRKDSKAGEGENFISKAVGIVWGVFGIFAVATGIMSYFFPLPTTGIIVLLLGMGGAISGALTGSWVIFVLGVISGLIGIPMNYMMESPVYVPLVMALAAMLDLIIPGLIFMGKVRKQ